MPTSKHAHNLGTTLYYWPTVELVTVQGNYPSIMVVPIFIHMISIYYGVMVTVTARFVSSFGHNDIILYEI